MKLRDATVDDSAAIAGLMTLLGYPTNDTPAIAARLAAQLVHPDVRVLVATDAPGAVLGVMALHFIPQLALEGAFCRISYVCIDPKGQRDGVGSALEAAAERLARERGCDRIELHCNARRTAAHDFYRKRGYTESPTYFLKSLVPDRRGVSV